MDKVIIMTDSDREKYKSPLLKYYIEKGKTDKEATEVIEKTFVECQMGWKNCPDDLDTRIKMKTGFQWKSHSNLRPRQKKVFKELNSAVEAIRIQNEESDSGTNYLFRYLTEGEKSWWQDRESIYYKEFEFNDSSDKLLLTQLLFEELHQRRLFLRQLKEPLCDCVKELNDSLKRITDLQVKLGITREQRSGALDNVDGNIADLSLTLEEKLKRIEEIEGAYNAEELMYANLKAQRQPYNILPPLEKVEAIIKVGEGYVPMTDEAAMREEPEEIIEVKEEKKELPIGSVI